MDLLTKLIRFGLGPGNVDPTYFHEWPRFADPNWQDECITPDPFGVYYIRTCLQVDSGMSE